MLILSLKVIHLFFAFAWMVGLLYLPRIFIYHHETVSGSAEEERFARMERRLMKIIMTPSMIIVLVAGMWLGIISGWFTAGWLHVKLLLVVFLAIYHMALAYLIKQFALGARPISVRMLKITNEFPTLILIGILILAVFKFF